MVASHSEHLLRYRASNCNGIGYLTFGAGGDDGSRASSSLPAGVRRLRSCQDVLHGAEGGVAEWMSGDDACGVKWRQLGPAVYASFEDMSDLQAQRSPMGIIINVPLVKPSSSRLYTRAHPRHRRRSPGPLGTHRGGLIAAALVPLHRAAIRAAVLLPGRRTAPAAPGRQLGHAGRTSHAPACRAPAPSCHDRVPSCEQHHSCADTVLHRARTARACTPHPAALLASDKPHAPGAVPAVPWPRKCTRQCACDPPPNPATPMRRPSSVAPDRHAACTSASRHPLRDHAVTPFSLFGPDFAHFVLTPNA
ncbi:hypothetical protein ABZP36_007506 [Zizania latifolia]